jgi:hypothetical protein
MLFTFAVVEQGNPEGMYNVTLCADLLQRTAYICAIRLLRNLDLEHPEPASVDM